MDYSHEIAFAREHAGEDPLRLLLKQSQYPDVDMKIVAQQLEGQRQASVKWPRLSRCEEFVYPPKLNREQSSSEQTSKYKVDVLLGIHPTDSQTISIADLTGGMGIDSIAFASAKEHDVTVDYNELDGALCDMMIHNTEVLGLDNIHCHQGDSIEWLRQCEKRFDLLYVDPARRGEHGKKLVAFEDCQPNIIEHLELLTSRCDRLVVKASPMIDLSMAIQQLRQVSEVYIIAVKGECKEVLFVCSQDTDETRYHCVNVLGEKSQTFTFTPSQEAAADITYCQHVGRYLYEPHSALMKGGCFRMIGAQYHLQSLGRNTHLYTSDTLVEAFPGRIFQIKQEIALTKKVVMRAIPEKKAHVVVRNFPVEAAKLQKQIGLSEGGQHFVIATTVGTTKCGFLCDIMG